MSETKFTPGPWLMEPSGSDSYELAPPDTEGRPDWSREVAVVISGTADANLIAAAPDLYEACRQLVAAMHQLDKSHHREVPFAEAAMAKARGES